MIKEKIKNMFEGKRKIENLIVLLVLMIIVVVAINYIWNGNNKKDSNQKNYDKNTQSITSNQVVQVSNDNDNNDLETKLEKILSNISGVGNVKVMITYSESSTLQPVYNENSKISNTTENDNSGGTRTISETDSQKEIIYKENTDGTKEPVTQSVISPKIEGAVIAAEGADRTEIKSNIIQAVEAATGLATHKIQVFKMEVGK